MEPTIYKPSIYKGAGIYKAGAEGGGELNLFCILDMIQGTRGVPDNQILWPYSYDSSYNKRICNKNVIQIPVGKKIKFKVDEGFSISCIDGTTAGQPHEVYAFDIEIEFYAKYGNITIAVKKNNDDNITVSDCNVFMYL